MFVIIFFLFNHTICLEYWEFDCLNCNFIRPSKHYFFRAWLGGCVLVRCLAWLCIDGSFIHLPCPIHTRCGPQIYPGPEPSQLLSYAKAALPTPHKTRAAWPHAPPFILLHTQHKTPTHMYSNRRRSQSTTLSPHLLQPQPPSPFAPTAVPFLAASHHCSIRIHFPRPPLRPHRRPSDPSTQPRPSVSAGHIPNFVN
jgi:hypothetical protein